MEFASDPRFCIKRGAWAVLLFQLWPGAQDFADVVWISNDASACEGTHKRAAMDLCGLERVKDFGLGQHRYWAS